MSDTGLEVGVLDMDKFVRLNNLKPVTNPVYLIKDLPTPDGVLSYEIFGTSQDDRRNRMAYIDLFTHYMCPIAAKKLRSYDRRLNEILYSTKKYRLADGDLIQDDEKGESGPEFLYSIWGKVKVKDKTTVTTKEIETFYQQDRSKLFWTKCPVIPAFYRDINDSGTAGKSSSEINSLYSSIISYAQSLQQFTDTFTGMTRMTQGRVQKLLVDLYDRLMINSVKGSPSKFGMLRRFLLSKNVDYSARLVITAPILATETVEEMQVRFGYAMLPLAYVLSCFFPFVVYHMKRFFDSEFIHGGKHLSMNKAGKIEQVLFKESFDENYITKLITKYINSPSSRFDYITTPEDENGNVGYMVLQGRFLKDNTTFTRKATLTDILYIVARRAVEDKHVFITRYPVDNYNGQFPARIQVSSTIKTVPMIIGEKIYRFFPVAEGDPSNAFIDTMEFSNTYLGPIGGDYDGDQISVKPVFSVEANKDCEKRINSPTYVLTISGSFMREMTKDFILTAYNLTKSTTELPDANKSKPKYQV